MSKSDHFGAGTHRWMDIPTWKDRMCTATILWRTIRTCLGVTRGFKPAIFCIVVHHFTTAALLGILELLANFTTRIVSTWNCLASYIVPATSVNCCKSLGDIVVVTRTRIVFHAEAEVKWRFVTPEVTISDLRYLHYCIHENSIHINHCCPT